MDIQQLNWHPGNCLFLGGVHLDDYIGPEKQGDDYRDNNTKYSIHVYVDKLSTINIVSSHNVMHFKTPELRNTFLKEPEIRKLLEIAKPLL